MPRTLFYPQWLASPPSEEVITQGISFVAQLGKIYLLTNTLTVTLPAPVLNGKVTLKSTGNFLIDVDANSTEEIEGVNPTYSFESIRESATFVSDGVDWFRI